MQNILPASFKTLELVWSEVQTLILSRTQHPSAKPTEPTERCVLNWCCSNLNLFSGDHNIPDGLAKILLLEHILWPKYNKLRLADRHQCRLNVQIRLLWQRREFTLQMLGFQCTRGLDNWH